MIPREVQAMGRMDMEPKQSSDKEGENLYGRLSRPEFSKPTLLERTLKYTPLE